MWRIDARIIENLKRLAPASSAVTTYTNDSASPSVESLFDAGHVPAAADADRAAFDADRCRAKLKETSRVTVPVVDIVKPPGPAPRAIRHQPIENRDADKRAAALRRVGIVLVGPRPACLRIDGGFRAGDGRAQPGPARSDLHVRPVLRQPKAPGIGRCGTRAKQRKNRNGGRSAKPGKLHATYFCQPGPLRASPNPNLRPPCTPKKPGTSVPGRLLSPLTQPNQRPNQLKRQTSSVEMNSVAFCELSAAPVTGIPPTDPLNGTLTPLPPYCE